MITTEPASENDVAEIKSIADNRENKYYLGFTNRAILSASIAQSELHIARINGKIVGFIRWHKRNDEWITVYEICVDESHRRQGIGRQLMSAIGTGPVRLKCHSGNPAVHFYKRLGFKTATTEITKGGRQLDFLIRY